MPIPPIALLLGLGAVAAAFALSGKSGSGGGASPQPVEPHVDPIGPGGPGVQPDPSQPFDCKQTAQWLAQTAVAIEAAHTTCQTNPNDPACSALPGWQQDWDAVAANYKAHTCDDPNLDCNGMRVYLDNTRADVQQAIDACKAAPSDPRCGAIDGWMVTLGALQDNYIKSCPGSVAETAASCAHQRAWLNEMSPKTKAVGDICHQTGDPTACASYNSMTQTLMDALNDYDAYCGKLTP